MVHKDSSLVSIKKRLNKIYPKEDAQVAFEGIQNIILKNQKKAKKQKRFSEKDVVLITYADSIKENGVKSLKTFKKFSGLLKGRINTVHFLPFFPYSSDDGFSVIDYGKIKKELGDWNDVKLVGKDFKLMFDFVLNHVSAKSGWFKGYLKGDSKYENFFISLDPKTNLSKVFRPRTSPLLSKFGNKHIWTTFSKDQVDPDYHNPNVLVMMLEYLALFVKNGAKLIRLDAIAYLWKQLGTSCLHLWQTHEVVKLIRDFLDLVGPDVLIVTETNVPHKENISYFGNKGDEAQMVYQFPLPPLVLHAFLRGDSRYITKWLRKVGSLPPSMTFFNFLASHDGIGVLPAKGLIPEKERLWLVDQVKKKKGYVSYKSVGKSKIPYELNINYFDALSNLDDLERINVKRFIAAYSIALSLQGIPGIYIHSLLGSKGWDKGVKKSGIKRRVNREKLNYDLLVQELKNKDQIRYGVFNGVGDLLEIRKKQKAFSPESSQKIIFLNKKILCIERGKGKERIKVVINISDVSVKLNCISSGKDLISNKKVDKNLVIEPYQVMWIK